MSLFDFFTFGIFKTKSFGQHLAEIAGVDNQDILNELQRDNSLHAGCSFFENFATAETNAALSAIETSMAIDAEIIELNNTCFDHSSLENDTFNFGNDSFDFGNN